MSEDSESHLDSRPKSFNGDFWDSVAERISSSEQEGKRDTALEKSEESSPLPLSQEEIFQQYYLSGNIIRSPADPDAVLDDGEIVHRLEVDHVVKSLKRFDEIASPEMLSGEQIDDEAYRQSARNTPLTYIAGQTESLEHRTSRPEWKDYRRTVTEQQAIDETWLFLNTAINAVELSGTSRDVAEALMKDLSYIGNRELSEATRGLALFWKKTLEENPHRTLHVATGVIAQSGYKDSYKQPQLKSDEFLLDCILAHFSDHDMKEYGARIKTGNDFSQSSIQVQVALLDDWSLSGSQFQKARIRAEIGNPAITGTLEIHQAIATERRTAVGLSRTEMEETERATPIIAYFEAHHSRLLSTKAGCHITGYHSSTNFDFEYSLQRIVAEARALPGSHPVLHALPPLANIVRPYRREEGAQFSHIDRLHEAQKISDVSIHEGDKL